MTPDEIKRKIEQARSQGVPDSVTFKYLNDRGLIPKEKLVMTKVEQEPSGLQSFVQTLARPALKVTSTLAGGAGRLIAGAIGGADAAQRAQDIAVEGIDYGYLGKVAPIGANAFKQYRNDEISGGKFVGKAALDFGGTAAEIGSYAIGGSGAAKTIATGLKGKVLQGAGRGALTGLLGGGTMSFGQALQEAEVKPSDVAVRTLFGGAVGAATGGIAGGITPVVVKGASGMKRFTNVDQVNTELQKLNTEAFKPTSRQLEGWSKQGKDPMKTYTEIFGTDIPAVGKDNRFTRESINDAVERVNEIYKPAAEGFNTILRNSPEVNSISKARDAAIKNLDAYNLTPEMKTKALQKIESNFDAIRNEAAQTGKLLGDDSIPVAYTDNLKDRFWTATKNFGTEDATIANSVNGSIGHGLKESIENSIQDINVNAYNKHLGDLIVLRDFLETKAGALAGTGGKMTRLMARVAGTVVGSTGGVPGAIMGNITGDKLAQVLINPAYQPYRWIINKKLAKLPQAEVLRLSQEANEVIEDMLKKRMSRLALPEGGKLGTVGNPIITPNRQGTPNFTAPNNKSAVAVSSKETQPLIRSESIPPTTIPTKITKNIPISNKLNTKKGFIKGADGGKVKNIHPDDKRVMRDFTDYVANEMGKLTERQKLELELAASRIAERYNIKGAKTLQGLANGFGRVLEDQGFKVGNIAKNPLIIGAGVSAAGAALAKLLGKNKKSQ